MTNTAPGSKLTVVTYIDETFGHVRKGVLRTDIGTEALAYVMPLTSKNDFSAWTRAISRKQITASQDAIINDEHALVLIH